MYGLGYYIRDGVEGWSLGSGHALGATSQETFASTGKWPTYTVRSGDSLSLITWRFGRPAAETLTLYAANASESFKDPNLINVGQVLNLPPAWPTGPTRSDRPSTAWINEAAKALKGAGWTYQAPPKPPAPQTNCAPGFHLYNGKCVPDVAPSPSPGPLPPGPKPVEAGMGGKQLLIMSLGLAAVYGLYTTFGKKGSR